MVAKALNPMDAYRREQKKKELKKNRVERQKTKQSKLATLDAEEIQEQIKKLERQILTNPTDGPTRKRKQEARLRYLEDTLKSVVKKRKEIEEEQRKQAETAPRAPKTLKDLEAENRERFQSPENSIYYHPTLNPFGAPPPGKPQMYRVPPPMPMARPPPPPRQQNHQQSQRGPPRFQPRGPRPPPTYDGRNGIPPPPPRPAASARVIPKRPGKRPPLPPGPIPPGTIQVPPRPPLPAGPSPFQPPPPPPTRQARPPPGIPSFDLGGLEQLETFSDEEFAAPQLDTEASDVVAPYPPPEDLAATPEPDQMLDDDEMEDKRVQLRSLVPVALRVQRKAAARPAPPPPRPIVSAPGPRPPPLVARPPPPPPRPAVPGPPTAPETVSKPSGTDTSVSKEFDAFMDKVQGLL